MARGWRGDSVRHALAAKGISTKNECDKLTINDISDMFNLEKLYHLTATGLKTEDNLKLSKGMTDLIKNLNEKADHTYEWIANLNYDDTIYFDNSVVSDKVDEAELDWRDSISQREQENTSEEADPENCVGYIHYHPSKVDERPTAQDYILALNLDEIRNEENKDAFRPTAFGVVRDNHIKMFFLTPSDEQREKYMKKFQNVEYKSKENYFDQVEGIIDEMEKNNILHKTEEIEYE